MIFFFLYHQILIYDFVTNNKVDFNLCCAGFLNENEKLCNLKPTLNNVGEWTLDKQAFPIRGKS
jgi:hypothetical protein